MKIGVIGIGRFGFQLAEQLVENGVDVMVVDTDESAIDPIKDKVSQSFVLHALEAKALRAMGVDELDTVVIAIGRNFAEAILLTYILKKELDIPNVIVRSSTGLKREILEHAGADLVILPEYEAATKLADDLSSPFPNLKRIAGDYCLGNMLLPEEFYDKPLKDLGLREEHEVICVGIKRDGDVHLPQPDFVMQEGDELYLAGNDTDLDDLTKIK